MSKPTFRILTLGCKVNQYESEAIAEELLRRGFSAAEGNKADIYIINTCTVTGESDRKSGQTVRRAIKQNPDAMQLKTFNDWKAKNVMINKGAKGISIIEPTEFEKSDGSKGTGYNVKKLFDVSQTNGMQREGYFKNLNDRQLLKALVSKSPIPIEAVDVIDGQRNAMFDIRNQKIFVKRGLEPTDFFRDVSIEMAHAEFAADNYGYNRSDHEYKARIAAYMLCRRYGVDVKDFAVALPDSYQEMKHKDIRAEFNTVRKAMNEINSRMNDAIEKQRKDKSEQER